MSSTPPEQRYGGVLNKDHVMDLEIGPAIQDTPKTNPCFSNKSWSMTFLNKEPIPTIQEGDDAIDRVCGVQKLDTVAGLLINDMERETRNESLEKESCLPIPTNQPLPLTTNIVHFHQNSDCTEAKQSDPIVGTLKVKNVTEATEETSNFKTSNFDSLSSEELNKVQAIVQVGTPQASGMCSAHLQPYHSGRIGKHQELDVNIGISVQGIGKMVPDALPREFWRKRIKENRVKLTEWLDIETTTLLEHLMQEEVITTEQAEHMDTKGLIEKKRWLLGHLLKRPNEDFHKFCKCLHNTMQGHIATFLEKEPQESVKLKIRASSDSGKEDLRSALRYAYVNLDRLITPGSCNLNIVLQGRNRVIEGVKEGCIEITITCHTVRALDELWDLISLGKIRKAVEKDLIEANAVDPANASALPVEISFDYEQYLITRMSIWDPTRDGPWEKHLRHKVAENHKGTLSTEAVNSSQEGNISTPTNHNPLNDDKDVSCKVFKDTDQTHSPFQPPMSREDINVPISMEVYCSRCASSVKWPRRLRCNHLFCQPCLNKLSNRGPHDRIICEVCGEPTPLPPIGVAGLPVPDYLAGTSEEQKLQIYDLVKRKNQRL